MLSKCGQALQTGAGQVTRRLLHPDAELPEVERLFAGIGKPAQGRTFPESGQLPDKTDQIRRRRNGQ